MYASIEMLKQALKKIILLNEIDDLVWKLKVDW